MKIGFYNFYDIYNKNRMFNPDIHAPIGDDLLYPLHHLARVARNKGISISTIDTEPLLSYDAIVFFDFPGKNNKYLKELSRIKFDSTFLFLFENEIIKSDNWEIQNYQYFKKVFTWKDTLIDSKRIFKFFLPNKIPECISFDRYEEKKFCCMIAGNKYVSHPLELYSERIAAIRWFEKNQPDSFDLYGIGWDEPIPIIPVQLPRAFLSLFKRFQSKYPSYRGKVTTKNAILKQYKFSLCYENARDIPGYITEKIFDCFFAGCVPIYWGAPNITEYIPENTFIDRRKFRNYQELFHYLKNLSTSEYMDYVSAIGKYVNSPEIFPFSAENFADTIFEKMLQ